MATQKLNIDIVAKDRSRQALNTLQGRLGKLKASVFNLRNAFIGLGAGLVIKNIVNTGKQIENLKVQLKFLFGSAEEGAKAFDEMAKFASKVPFSLEEIQAGSGVLAVVSDDAKELANLMKITGNVAAVTGLDFKTTAEQIQRSLSAGISAADLFRDKGVKDMLGFSAGAKVSVEETAKAFERVFGRGGKYGNATKELAKTFEGTLSMIGDKVFNFKRVLLEAGFFKELKKQFGDLDKFLADNAKDLDRIATAVGKNLAQGMVKVVNIGKDLIPTIQNIGKILKSIVDGFMALPPFVQSVGLVGAFIFGKKGAAALAGISFLIDKVSDFMDDTKIKAGIVDLDNVEEVEKRLKAIKEQQGEIFRVMSEGLVVSEKITIEGSELVGYNQENLDLLEKEKKQLESQLYWMKNKSVHALGIFKTIDATVEKQKELTFEDQAMLNHIEASHEAMHKIMNITKETTKEVEKQHQAYKNIHEAHLQFKNQVEVQNTLQMEVWQKLKDQNEQWSLSDELVSVVNNGVQGFSRMLAEAVVYGKKINASFKELAQGLLVDILAKMIERIALIMIEQFILNKIISKDKDKLAMEKAITKEKQKQVFYQALLMAMGGGGGGIKLFASGGTVSKGKPIVVGERGPEVFVPNSSGQIQQNARGTGGGTVNVNFNIEAIDSNSFNDVLVENRGVITSIINNALNEKGRRELI